MTLLAAAASQQATTTTTTTAAATTTTTTTGGGPLTLTYTAAATTLVSDGRYNSFPGVVTCPNGDILAAYRSGTSHLDDGDLYTLRSTDNGATWGSPVLVASATLTECYGTATLSVIDAGRLALVSWIRNPDGSAPVGHATLVFISDDNGATWDAPVSVTFGTPWLGSFTVSESALVHRDGWFYLALWGRDTATSYSKSGIARSADLTTWTTVATFDAGVADGFNECGIGNFGTSLVCMIRHETGGRWVSTSADGATWSTPTQVWGGTGQGAPKLAQEPMLGWNIFPVRPASTGLLMASVNAAGTYYHLGTQATSTTFMYGQTCKISATTGGMVYAVGGYSGGVSELFWRPFSVS